MARALIRWQCAAGPYWPYVCAAPFLGPPPPGGLPTARRWPLPDGVLTGWLRARLSPGTALYLDLAPERALGLAPLLAQLGSYPVPVVQRWVAWPAVLPCRRLLGALLSFSTLVRQPRTPRSVAFLLDGERAGQTPIPDPLAAQTVLPPVRGGSRAFDNRYFLRADRFPTPDRLLAGGVERAVWLGPDGLAADLRPYAGELRSAGLVVESVRLAELPLALPPA